MAAAVVNRPTPWDLVLASVSARYASLHALPADPAAFTRDPGLQRLLADIESPDLVERAPEAAAEYQYLLLADVLHWRHGRPVLPLSRAGLDRALAGPPPASGRGPATLYVQLPLRTVWGQPDPAGPHEPLDGCYVAPLVRDELLVVGVFGLHAGRAGLSQVTVTLPAGDLDRAGAALPEDPFAPAMPGGAEAGFRSVRTTAELLQLVRVALDSDGA